jgi:hypothetical protein
VQRQLEKRESERPGDIRRLLRRIKRIAQARRHDHARACSLESSALVRPTWGDLDMPENHSELDQMQKAYIAAVDQWIEAIKQEEALASVNHTVAEVDKWENAHFKEDELRNRVKAAKKEYEDALREEFYGF